MNDFLEGFRTEDEDDGVDLVVTHRDAIPPPAPAGQGTKHDAGKVPLHLIFRHNIVGAVREMARVIAFGAEKYGTDNWELVENGAQRYSAALTRHVASFISGEHFDEETGFHHLAHVMANCAFLIHLTRKQEAPASFARRTLSFVCKGVRFTQLGDAE